MTDTTDNAVDVLAGNGDGTFQNAVPWNAGFSPQVLAVGDFNGDGRADILSSLILNINDLTGKLSSRCCCWALLRATVPQITTTSLPVATVGVSYSATLTATGGTPPYSNWTVSSGSLPPGLILNAATGAISGIPTLLVTFAYSFNVTVQDSAGNLAPEAALADQYRLKAVTISMITLPGGTVGAAYSQTLTATGGASSTYTWAISSGSLPPGLTLNPSTGVIGGTPTTATGSPFSFGVTASDTAGRVLGGEGRIFQSRLRPRLRRPRSR